LCGGLGCALGFLVGAILDAQEQAKRNSDRAQGVPVVAVTMGFNGEAALLRGALGGIIGTIVGVAIGARTKNWLALALIVGVYTVSLFLPAVSIPVRSGEYNEALSYMELSGEAAFRLGIDWGFIPFSIVGAAWLGNPVVWLGTVFLAVRRNLLAGMAGLLALALILIFYVDGISGPGDKSGYLVGYWLWFSSAALLAVAGFGLWLLPRNVRKLAAQGAALKGIVGQES
jgi:hypothetical protein